MILGLQPRACEVHMNNFQQAQMPIQQATLSGHSSFFQVQVDLFLSQLVCVLVQLSILSDILSDEAIV